MPVRPEVREAQRLLAALDAAHAHALGRLAQAVERRAEVLAEQDRLVASAQEAWTKPWPTWPTTSRLSSPPNFSTSARQK